jgi:cephalosporin hydroxylase
MKPAGSENPIAAFEKECAERVAQYAGDAAWRATSAAWMQKAFDRKYMYNFSFLGRPIIQTPIDMVATQELIWSVKPDLILEIGIAHGGSLIQSAAMLALIEYAEAVETGTPLDPRAPARRVLAVDIDIRAHNRAAIEAHPMANRIEMREGSSIAAETIAEVRARAANARKVLVFLDSNHTHEHVLAELEAYAPLVSPGSYCVVFDTIVEDLPGDAFPDRPWAPGNSPKTAVWEYLKRLSTGERKDLAGRRLAFEIDHAFESKLVLTVAPDGYLRRV